MKKNRFFPVLIGLIVSTLWPLSAFSQPATEKKEPKNDSAALLYKITGKDLAKPSYLFGTIHIICPNDLFGMEQLGGYLQQTDRLYLEIDMDNPEVMSKMMSALSMPPGKSLQDYLTPEKYAKVDEMFQSVLGVPVGMLGRFSPFGLSVAIGASPKATGCPVPASYETKLVELAAAINKTVDGLETIEEQIAAINKTPIEKQAEGLYKMALDPQKSITQFKDLLAAYKLQDAEKLMEFITSQSTDDPDFQKNLLDERNKNWIPRIEKAIKEMPTFIAVGGGHLGGQTGVVRLLREQGYTVEPIKF